MAVPETLHAAIEQCYDAFASEPLPRKLDTSPLRDGDEILRALSSAPLRELSGEQVGPYSGWAITTVGTERDYRHFLPRVLELAVTDPVWLGAEPSIIASRLKMADWRTWPVDQQSAVLGFFRAAFDAAIAAHPDEGQSADHWLCALVSLGESPTLLTQHWLSSKSANAALQMATFIKYESKHLCRHGVVSGPFWEDVDEEARRDVGKLLLSDATKRLLQVAAGQVTDDDCFFVIEAALCELQRQS